jgi:uncharacterized membrane protein
MGKSRIEAFSDGVIAIIITIMVLELKVPHGASFNDLLALAPVMVSYVLSFTYVGIYWNNHHHLFQAVHEVHGGILWANLHLLFWLSLIPFTSGWMGENHFATAPVALYGANLFVCAIAYTILTRSLTRHHAENQAVADAIGSDRKGWLSLAMYLLGIAAACIHPWLGFGIYVLVAAIWFIPDRRIEKQLARQ